MKMETILGVLMVSALGTLFHFMYQWVPIFPFPHNESIFEHTKLIFFPFVGYGIYYLIRHKERRREAFASLVTAIFVAILVVVVGYYTYSGFIGKNMDAVNILLYYVAVMIGFLIFYKKKILFSYYNSIIYLIILFILIVIWTYFPPNLAFFWS